MSWANQLFQVDSWNRNVSFSDSHLDLKFADNLIGDVDNFLKHVNLFFTSDNADLCVFEEGISCRPVVEIKIELGSNFPKEDEVTLDDKMHLNFI